MPFYCASTELKVQQKMSLFQQDCCDASLRTNTALKCLFKQVTMMKSVLRNIFESY